MTQEGYQLVRVKRDWVPNWLFAAWATTLPPLVWPFRQIFTRAAQ